MRLSRLLLLLPAVLRSSIAYTVLSDASLQSLPEPGADFDIETGRILAPILRTRVPGTHGSQEVLFHFVNFFVEYLPRWTITFQNSTSTTPMSNGAEVPFTNLIATRDPPWVKGDGEVGRLALVAHYDSKLHPEGFIGAVDSAAPCAMILHAARSIDEALTKKWELAQQVRTESDGLEEMEAEKGVQILLLDGEEAFLTWSGTDNTYGARSLAEEWENTMHPAMSTYSTPLASIDLFVLLDLLGSANPKVPSYFLTTHWAYRLMADVEKRLRAVGKFKSSPNHPSKRNEKRQAEPRWLHEKIKSKGERWLGGLIGDDHEPFLARGVEILHIIPSPFPRVWHEITDDGAHLDMDTTEDWAVLTAAFAAEWLDLEGFLPQGDDTGARRNMAAVGKDELFGKHR